jgi:nucleoside-diphosphate-sugar epimerase
MNKICILGGLGYIGYHLTKLVLDNTRFKEIVIFDNLTFGKSHMMNLLNNPRVTLIEGDITDAIDLAKAIKDSDVVINLAGIVGDPACSIDENDTWLVNIESSRIIADVVNHYDVSRFVFASSCSVYGASPSHIILNEGSYLNPISWYAKSKIDSERIFSERIKGCSTNIRLATVFGYSNRMRFDLVANLFTIKALKEGKLEVFGGEQFRPFIHCKDAARAFLKVATFKDTTKINRENFNIVSENISIKELGHLICKLVKGSRVKHVSQKEDNRNYKVSGDKANWILQYEPFYNLETGIKTMIKSINNRIHADWKDNKLYYNHLCVKEINNDTCSET